MVRVSFFGKAPPREPISVYTNHMLVIHQQVVTNRVRIRCFFFISGDRRIAEWVCEKTGVYVANVPLE